MPEKEADRERERKETEVRLRQVQREGYKKTDEQIEWQQKTH